MNDGLGGVYRATFLSVDDLGNVMCVIPAVTGNAPMRALSRNVDFNHLPIPGELGWVVFEGNDPAMPVWIGSSVPTPADPPPPTWITWTAWDLQFDGVGGYSVGNAQLFFEYRVEGDLCDFKFTYKLGNTTGFPSSAGSYIRVKLPFSSASGSLRGPIGRVHGFDAGTGLGASGDMLISSGDAPAAYLSGPPNYSVSTASIGALEDLWQNTASNQHPFRSGTGTRRVWTTNDEIEGWGRYRVVVP